MANTAELTKKIYPYVLKEVSRRIGICLTEKRIKIGSPKREKKFDGVSEDENIVVSISTSSGYSKSGKLPVGKINAIYMCCYMMNLTSAKRKILAFTNEEFYRIIQEKTKGYLFHFELLYVELTEDLKELSKSVNDIASKEMS
jgi:hypothetical protein